MYSCCLPSFEIPYPIEWLLNINFYWLIKNNYELKF